MPLLPYEELVKINVLPFCDNRKAKDDEGNTVNVPYLNWAKCVELLHEHGAGSVYYIPVKSPDGGYLFTSKEVQDKRGRTTGCYFVSVEIHIDELVFTMDMPLLNGSLVVYDDTLNQLRIANCHARAFVKGVAIRTGLGFSLWVTDKDTDAAPDDLSTHSIYAIKQRVEQLVTAKMQNGGYTQRDLCDALGLSEKQFTVLMKSFESIGTLESKLARL